MAGVLFDTSVYISNLRQGNAALFALRRATREEGEPSHPLWLSVVVLEELLQVRRISVSKSYLFV